VARRFNSRDADALSRLPLLTDADILAYLEAVRQLASQMSKEIDLGAGQVHGGLRRVPAGKGLTPSAVRARRVSRHIRRASELQARAAVAAVRAAKTFEREFEAERQRPKRAPAAATKFVP
jgi:hypothetical protein